MAVILIIAPLMLLQVGHKFNFMTTQTTTQTPSPGLQMFYKPGAGQPGYDANNPQAVYDTAGNLISLDQYKTATGQTATPDQDLDWGAVQQGAPAGGFSNNPTFDPNSIPGLSQIWGQLTPAQQAFVQSAHGVVQGQYNAGGAATVDQDTWNKALQIAATDPTIQSQYGDAAKEGAQQLAFDVSNVTGNYNAATAKNQADAQAAQTSLQSQIASANDAYSSYANQARQQLGAQQNQIIQSTRSQYASQLQNLGSQYEKQFGSSALSAPGTPALTLGASGPNQLSYQPVGGVIGSNTQGQTNDEITTAQGLGLLPTANPSTGTVSTTGH